MRCDIDPKSVQQLIDRAFESLQRKLKMARSEEERTHLIIDTQQYFHGLEDFYLTVVPVNSPSRILTVGEVDDETMIQTLLKTALHQIHHMLEQPESLGNCKGTAWH